MDLEKSELDKIGAFLVESSSNNEEDIISVAEDADALLVGYANISKKIIRSLKKCRIIARYGIGVDNIDIRAADHYGIYVTNVPDYCVDEVSNHTFALILALSRKIVNINSSVKKGIWSYSIHRPIYRVYGKVLGLIGFGKIARVLVKKVKNFGFEILVYDPYVSSRILKEYDVKYASLNEIFQKSDYISLHAPLTNETRYIINKKELKMMKETAYLINTSRGLLVDEDALFIALKEKWISGAALDVLTNEKEINSNHPLLKLENIILTPHMAFYSEESIKDLRFKAVNEVVRALMNLPLRYCVNKMI